MNGGAVKNIEERNINKNITTTQPKQDDELSFHILGQNSAEKFKEALGKNKEFIDSLILIGKSILKMISIPECAEKLGYEWGEIGKEGLYLVKRLGDSLIRVDCIPFDILGFFSIQKNLASLGIKIPGLPLPNLEIINKILELSTFNPLSLIKEMLTFDPLGLKCIADIDKWKIKDYVYNCLKSSNQS
jgi:hypothetical protein